MAAKKKSLAQFPRKAAAPAAQGPRENINYKDLPPDEQAQMAEQAGLHPGPPPLPPGVVSPMMKEAAEETAEPKDNAAEEGTEHLSKHEIPVPKGHHAVTAHVRKNPVSQMGRQKLARRGVVVK